MELLFINGKKKRIFDFFSKEYGTNIIVTDIRPGFVDTGRAKCDGLFGYRKEKVVYVTKRWSLIGILLKILPL